MQLLKNFMLLLFVVLFTACGGGGGGDSSPTPPSDDSSTQAVLGYVVDNYIKNATVCIDSNKNNLCDTNETSTTTDENGSFEFNIEVPSDSIIIAYGGEDAITDVSFNHLIKNIATNTDSNDKLILSSINTLITEVYNESNSTLPNAITLVNNFLGGVSQNIEETNIIEDIIANKSTQSDEFLRSLKLFQMVEQGADSIDSNLSIEIFNQLAKFILSDINATHESTDINVTINSVVKNLYVQDSYPVFVLKPSGEVELGQSYVLDLNNSAVSPDGKSVSYEVINDTNIFEINGTKIYFKSAPSVTGDYIVTIEANNSVKTNDINLSIRVINDTPILQAISNQEIDEDSSLLLEINASDFSSSLNYNASSSDSNVSISWNENNLTLTPSANWYGTSTIQVVVDDGDKNDTKSFTLTVNSINDTPVLQSISNQSIDEDTDITLEIIASDIETTNLNYNASSSDSNVSISWNENNLTLTPSVNWYGNSTIQIIVDDGDKNDTKTFTLTVNSINDTPIITTIADQTVDEDNNLTITISANDIETTSLNYNANSSDSNVTLTWSTNNLKMAPASNWYGTSTIQVVVDDGDKNDTKSFILTVNSINDAPILETIANQSINEDTNLTIEINASDIETTNLNYNASSSDSNVTLTWSTNNLKMVPVLNWYGTTTIEVVVDDGDKNDTQTFTLSVNSINDAPSSSDKTFTIEEDTNKTFVLNDFNFTDIDSGDSLDSIYIASLPSSGALKLNNLSVVQNEKIIASDISNLVFVPVPNENGTLYDTFTFKVFDGEANSSSQTITINVTALNDAPTSSNLTFTINEDNNLTFSESNFIDVHNDPDGDGLSKIYITSLETNGALKFDGNDVVLNQEINARDINKLKFIPVTDAYGTPYAVFKYLVNDGDLNSSQEYNATINVKSVIDWNTPTDELRLLEDFGSYNLVIADIDTGGSEANLSYVLDKNESLTLPNDAQDVNDNDTVLIALNSKDNKNGEEILTLTLKRDSEILFTKEINITIAPVNDQPIYDESTVEDKNISYGLDGSASIGGIGDGDNEVTQTIYPYVTSSNTTVVSSIDNIRWSTSDTLTFDLITGEPGIAEINVTLEDDGNTGIEGDNNTTSFVFEVRVRANGWKIYQDQKTSGYTINNVDFDGVRYDWNSTNRWYETSSSVLMPVVTLSSAIHAGYNFNKVANGHYYVNKSDYMHAIRQTEGVQHYPSSSYYESADGNISGIKAFDAYAQHDQTHHTFISKIVVDGTGITTENYNNGWLDESSSVYVDANESNSSYGLSKDIFAGTSVKIDTANNGNDYCSRIYGAGWRLPTSYEMGINVSSSNVNYKGYIPAFVGESDNYVISSTLGSDTKHWVIANAWGASSGSVINKNGNYVRCLFVP